MARFETYKRTVMAIVVACSMSISNISAVEAGEAYIAPAELEDILKTRNIDRILNALNTVKRMEYQGTVLPLVRDMWDNKKDKYPDLPWDVITSDIVRLDVANILLQAANNGKIEVDIDKLHAFTERLLNNQDVDIVRNAITTLSLFNRDADVEKLYSIARDQKKATFRAAVVALSNMCSKVAEKSLNDLEEYVTEPDAKIYIADTKRKYQSFKASSGWCNTKSQKSP